MENAEVQIITDNFSIESLTSGSREKAVTTTEAKRLDRTVFSIHPSKIVVMPEFNLRIKNADYWNKVRELADSIKANGYYQHKPIACIVIKQDGQDVLACFDGFTRLDASLLVIKEGHPQENVYVNVAQAGTTLEDITVGLVTNNSGRQLEPMAIGLVCKRLQGYGLDNTTIAKRLGFSLAYIGQLFELIGADRKIRDLVNDDKISATMALQVMKEEGENAPKVLQDAVQAAQAKGKVRATKKDVKPSVKPAKPVIDVQVKSVQPLMPSPSVVPYDAVTIQESLKFSQAAMLTHGVEWLKANTGVIDDSHYELVQAITGTPVIELKESVELIKSA